MIILIFSSPLLKTQMALSEKIISYKKFSDLHFKETRIFNISEKVSLKNDHKKEPNGLLC